MINRRRFLQVMLAAAAAPAYVRFGSLMKPASVVWTPAAAVHPVKSIATNRNRLLSAEEVARMALRILHRQLGLLPPDECQELSGDFDVVKYRNQPTLFSARPNDGSHARADILIG